MIPTDSRAALVKGLLDLAAFLEATPGVPVPSFLMVHHFARGTDAEMCAEIDGIAELLGTDVDPGDLDHDHYRTGLTFGPVEYTAVAILARAQARHDANQSYAGCVDLAPVTPADAPPHAA